MKNNYRKLLINTGLMAIGSFATSLLGVLMIPLYTNVLSTREYGISDLITVTTSLLFPFISISISESIMRFALDKDNDRKSIFSLGLLIVTIGCALVVFTSPLLTNTTIGQYKFYFILYVIGYCLHTITIYFVKGLEEIKLFSIAGIINTIVVIGCNLIFLLVLKIGINGYLLSFILGQFVSTTFLFFTCKLYKYIVFPRCIDKCLAKAMMLYSIPIIPNSISWWIANSSDKYILNHYCDVSQVGIYAVSYKIPTIMMTIMGFFISSWQLSSVEKFGTQESRDFFSSVYNKYVAISIVLATMLIITAKPISSFLYSKDFFIAWRYVPVLVLANVFNMLASFMGTVYTASKKTGMLSLSTMIGAGLNIVLNFIFIPRFGAMGAAIATAFSYACMLLIRVIHTRTIFSFKIDYRRDLVLYSLLVLQIICLVLDSIYYNIISLIITIIILYILKPFILLMINTAYSSVKNRLFKNKL